jgi:hypothetical protein
MLMLTALFFGLSRMGCGVGYVLPLTVNASAVAGFVVSFAIILGWVPTLAVGIYRVLRGQ